MSTQIDYTIADDGVATLKLNRPEKLNAVTPDMTTDIIRIANDINHNREVRVVVLTGEGDRSFCVGSDIKELDTYTTAWEFRSRPDYCDAVRNIVKPVIAAINGYCMGGGLELALSSDIRVASRTATFAAPEIKLGWIGGGGVAGLLTHSVGSSNAGSMIYSGEPIDSSRALSWGLISEVAEPADLRQRVYEMAGQIASRPPIAAETAKLNMRAAYSMPLETSIQYERDLQTFCFTTEDAFEGRRAFKEKRQPQFKGR